MSTTMNEADPAAGDPYAPAKDVQEFPYRAVSKSAVVGLVLALLGGAGLLFAPMVILGLLGAVAGGYGLWAIRRYPMELTGRIPAILGIVLGIVFFASGTAWHCYVFATEVPDGYERIYFSQLTPARGAQEPVPQSAVDLNGRKIFVKGYVHPGVQSQGDVRQFVLVPDMGTCCFGGQPKLTDMIEVTLQEPHQIRYSTRIRRLGGVLRVQQHVRQVAGGLHGGYYSLDGDYLK